MRLLPASEHEIAAAMLCVLALQDTGWPCKSSKEAKGFWDSPDSGRHLSTWIASKQCARARRTQTPALVTPA